MISFDLYIKFFSYCYVNFRLFPKTSNPTFSSFVFSLTGERIFPPPHGLTFSTWLCVLRFDRFRPHSAVLPLDSAPIDRPRRGSSPTAPHSQSASTHDSITSGAQPQAVHLLTIVRGIQSVNDQLICLRIFIHPRTRMLVVSTQERLAQPGRFACFHDRFDEGNFFSVELRLACKQCD